MCYRKQFPVGTIEALEHRLKNTKNIQELRRIQVVYYRAKYNYPPVQIAKMTGYSVGTIRNIHSEYMACGVTIFNIGKTGGRKAAYMTPEEEKDFLQPFIARSDKGWILEISSIHKAHCAVIGKNIPVSTTYRLLHRNGWRKIMPRPRHPKADKSAQALFKKLA